MAPRGEFPSMDVRESSKKRVRELVESWFLERCLAKDEQETSIDFGKRLSSEFMMPPKVDKAKIVAVDGERKLFSGAAEAERSIDKMVVQMDKIERGLQTAVDSMQAEKMDKMVVPMDKIEKAVDHMQAEKKMDKMVVPMDKIETAVDHMQAEKKMDKCAESDPPAAVVNGKHRLPDDYVTLVLAMPVEEEPIDTDEFSSITDLAKLLNRSDDWIEKQKHRYMERAALSKRINDRFLQFQDSIREEWITQGYVQSEQDYEDSLAETLEYSDQLWSKYSDFSGLE